MKPSKNYLVYDPNLWYSSLMSGSAHYVSQDSSETPPHLVVPDPVRGGYKQHEVPKKPKGKLGFR